jgi:CHAD domain-containing protein
MGEAGKFVFKYYRKRIKLIQLYIQKLKVSLDRDAIHDLRVEIKKLRALFYFLENAGLIKFSSPKAFLIIKPVFKKAGRIRESQLNLEMIKTYKLKSREISFYKIFLEKNIKKNEKIFLKKVNDFDRKILKKQKISVEKICQKFDNQNFMIIFSRIIKNNLKKIRKLTASVIADEKLHKIRMNLKHIDSMISLYLNWKPDDDVNNILLSIKEVEDIMGKWHDKFIFLESMNHFYAKN